jgi:tRNA nucleotidyltransferase (CCA-adding enzyme)
LQRRIPAVVKKNLNLLLSGGYQAFLAGGCVRDMILGVTPRDWDIVTNAPLDELKQMFPHAHTVGESFGILKLPPTQGIEMDVAIFRQDGPYSDGRHPDTISVGDLQSDQARRDFTVNALYWNHASAKIIDGVGGLKDLKMKQLRTVGQAETRFSEDGLRILRALRFETQLKAKIHPQTKAAIKKCRDNLTRISRERIRAEVVRALSYPNATTFLLSLVKSDLWPLVFGTQFKAPTSALLKQWSKKRLAKAAAAHSWYFEAWVAALASRSPQPPMAVDKAFLKLSNHEHRVIILCLRFLTGVHQMQAPNSIEHLQPHEVVCLEKDYPGLLAFVASFYKKSIFLQRAQKIVKRMAKKKRLPWVEAKDLLQEGLVPGPALGAELHRRNWALFWGRA